MDDSKTQQWRVRIDSEEPFLVLIQPLPGYAIGDIVITHQSPTASIVQVTNLQEGIGPPEDQYLIPRSGKWATVRKKFLEKHPTCAACGGTEYIQAHHCKPFHLFPELELEESNLIALCQSPIRCCHFAIGHAFSWHDWVPTVREDAALLLGRRLSRRSTGLDEPIE